MSSDDILELVLPSRPANWLNWLIMIIQFNCLGLRSLHDSASALDLMPGDRILGSLLVTFSPPLSHSRIEPNGFFWEIPVFSLDSLLPCLVALWGLSKLSLSFQSEAPALWGRSVSEIPMNYKIVAFLITRRGPNLSRGLS